MSVAPADYLAAIEHLPAGGVLRFDHVPWEEYENLLADLGEGYAVRIFYDNGRMEIMAPSSTHEKAKSVIHRLVTCISDELDIVVESLGSTTLKKEMKARGAEPDDCFYIQNATVVIGKDDLNLDYDPAPDVVVEIDRTNSSLNKFSIYAALGVSEIWRVVGLRADIYLLADDRYSQSDTSRAIPFVTASDLSDFLVLGLREGETRVARSVRDWIREHQRSSSEP